jgi:putative flippase GtrA
MHSELKKAFKFALVGILNTLVGIFLIYLFRTITGNEILANILAYSLGFVTSYYLNGKLTFSSKIICLKTFLRFLIAFVFSWLLNIFVVLFFITQKYPPEISHLLGMPVFTITFYFLSRFYVFINSNEHSEYKNIKCE